jgi:hypothetical protein
MQVGVNWALSLPHLSLMAQHWKILSEWTDKAGLPRFGSNDSFMTVVQVKSSTSWQR